MIEIGEFFKGKISWINFIILNKTKKGFQSSEKKRMFDFTFPLGKPSSFKISNIRFSVLPDANVLLILKPTNINQTRTRRFFLPSNRNFLINI